MPMFEFLSQSSMNTLDNMIEYSPQSRDIYLIKKVLEANVAYGHSNVISTSIKATKGIVLFDNEAKSHIAKIGILNDSNESVPPEIIGYFKQVDNVQIKDIIRIVIMGVSRDFEVVDIKGHDFYEPFKRFYILSPSKRSINKG
jgi:hypothetical protein